MKATGTKYLQMMKTMVECPMNNMQLGTGTMTIYNIGNLPNGPMKVVANWR